MAAQVHVHEPDTILELLPQDLQIAILTLLSAEDLRQVGKTCKAFLLVSSHERLWHRLCEEHFGITYKLPGTSWKTTYCQLGQRINVCPHLRWLDDQYLEAVFAKLTRRFESSRVKVVCDGHSLDESKCTIPINNLWMCVTPGCFYVGCGRRDNEHMFNHIKETDHTLTLKLTSLELYCYKCEQWVGGSDKHEMEHHRYLQIREVLARNTDVRFDSALVDRRRKERELPFLREGMRCWVVINPEWEKRWERFIIGDIDDFNEAIDNSQITIEYIMVGGKYSFVSLLTWRHLIEQYGGGPLVLYDSREQQWSFDPSGVEEMYKAAERELKHFSVIREYAVPPLPPPHSLHLRVARGTRRRRNRPQQRGPGRRGGECRGRGRMGRCRGVLERFGRRRVIERLR
jgi:hypothetical protein